MIISFTIDKNTVRNAKRRNLHPVEQAIQSTTKNYNLFIDDGGDRFELVLQDTDGVTTLSGIPKAVEKLFTLETQPTLPVTFKLNLPKHVVNPQPAKVAAKSSSKTKTSTKK